jgi:hypothetical protein
LKVYIKLKELVGELEMGGGLGYNVNVGKMGNGIEENGG